MITKENAMQIYNLYSQIEKSNEIINVLKQCKDRYEKDNEGVDIIRNTWGNHQSIELHVPHRFLDPNESSYNGARIYQISVPDAILVLENHIVRLSKALEEEQKKAME
jgi:5-methylcytosine-specific restriction endonuclease McrBC regulatory subunit McrC